MTAKLSDISKMTIQRYSDRYSSMGYNVRTLGWGTTEQQFYRFHQTLLAGIDFRGKRVLDIGCGFGDYARFLDEAGINIDHYMGWDLNPDLIKESIKISGENLKADFEIVDIMDARYVAEPTHDIGVALGVLNFNLKDQYDNLEFSFEFIRRAFSSVRETLIVDFLSSELTLEYPREDFVFYHNPVEMLKFGLSLTPNCQLKHDYRPIPQREFMLILNKE